MTENVTAKLQPWLTPDDTVEALELITELKEFLRNTAQYAPMRASLRRNFEVKAGACDEFVNRCNRGSIDPAIVLALDALAIKRKITVDVLIAEALEMFVSKINRRAL